MSSITIINTTVTIYAHFDIFTGNREDITIPEKLVEKLETMNNLFSDVVAPKEAALDAEGFLLLSTIGREQVCSNKTIVSIYLVVDSVLFFRRGV